MSKRVRIAFLICAIVFGCSGVIILSLGLVSQQELKKFVTTSETTAVVNYKEIKTHQERSGSGPGAFTRTVKDFWVYLDFSNSDLGMETIAHLNQQRQGIELRYERDYNSFHIGQNVIIVYHIPESLHEKLCIESVDNCEVWSGSGDLTAPHEEASWPIFYFVLGGLSIGIAVLSLVGCYHRAIDDYVKSGYFPFGPIERRYFGSVKILPRAVGKTLLTIFLAGFGPSIMITYGGDIGNWLLIVNGWLVFMILFYFIGCWKYIGLLKTWREVFKEKGRK